MKIVWYQKILSILIIGLLIFIHPVCLGSQYTEETTEKKSSEESKNEDAFGDKEKSGFARVVECFAKKYTAIAFNRPIGFYSHRLFAHLNRIPRPPPINTYTSLKKV